MTTQKIRMLTLAATLMLGLSLHAKEVRLDFGTEKSPLEPEWTRVTPRGIEGKIPFEWILAPTEAVDVPQADPLDALGRDGVRFTNEKPLEFGVELPAGAYDLSVLLGERSDSFRPGMFVEVNGKRVISAVYGFIGMPMWSRARVEHPGGKLRVRAGVERETPATGALLALRVTPAADSRWQPAIFSSEEWRPAIRWIATERIRAIYGMASQYQYDEKKGYFTDTTEALWKRAAGTGMNCVLSPYSEGMGRFFQDAGMRFFHVLNFASGERYTLRRDKFQKNVVSSGQEDDRPNPLDENAWREQVLNPALDAWRRAKADGIPLAGVVIDLEMYGAKYMEVYRSACTFDEANFVEFCRANFPDLGSPEQVAAGKRFETLLNAGKLQEYYEFLEKKLARITGEIEKAIHREAPDLLIGYLQHYDNWFFRGMIRGLGTREMPVLAFGENTYYGYNGDAPFEKAALVARDAHALYCVGLWPRMIHPERLWKDAFLAGVESAGFWIYGYGYPLAKSDPVAEMDGALRRANTALADFLKTGKFAAVGEVNHSLKSPFSSKEEAIAKDAVDADKHSTHCEPLPGWQNAVAKFDFGLPGSPLAEGWTRVTSLDEWNSNKTFGWERFPRMSFDRSENAGKVLGKDNPALALLADGITSSGKNTFTAKVSPGRYKVSLLLGDLGLNEFRTHQNATVNGVLLANNITTNADEYRIFSASVESKDGFIHLALEGRGAQQDVPVIAMVIEPEASH